MCGHGRELVHAQGREGGGALLTPDPTQDSQALFAVWLSTSLFSTGLWVMVPS